MFSVQRLQPDHFWSILKEFSSHFGSGSGSTLSIAAVWNVHVLIPIKARESQAEMCKPLPASSQRLQYGNRNMLYR